MLSQEASTASDSIDSLRDRFVRLPLALLDSLVAFGVTASAWAVEPPVDFERDVRPILNEHCAGCHGGVKQAGGVSFIWAEQVLPPDGWAAIPGDPDASPMFTRLRETDPDLRMPPPEEHPQPLSDDEVETIRRWIAEGASWRQHWSLAMPQRPTVPPVAEVTSPIDAFIDARLAAEGIEPSMPASPDRWLRRATLDLTGLLPSPSDRESFLADVATRGEAAYAAAVDRLLASPHYGQRWASVWLDQIRYADSKGLGHDFYRTMWPYRDWVVDALNADMPYDEFTRKQLAGDLLENPTEADLIATAAQRLTATNDEGGTDDEQFRVEAVLDRTNTTWQVWQAMSFGCAQCHDHPYDPITQSEYYEFVAFFNNTRDVDLRDDKPTLELAVDPAESERLAGLRRTIHDLDQTRWDELARRLAPVDWQPIEAMDAKSNKVGMKVEAVTRNGVTQAEAITDGTVPRNITVTLDATLPPSLERLGGARLTALPRDVSAALANPEWGFVLSHVTVELVGADGNVRLVELAEVVPDEPHPFLRADKSRNASNDDGWSAFTRIHRPRSAVLVPKHEQPLRGGESLRVTMRFGQVAHGSFPLYIHRAALAVTDDPSVQAIAEDAELADLRVRREAASSERYAIERHFLPVMQELDEPHRRPTHRFERGNMLDKAEEVFAGTPQQYGRGGERRSRADLVDWLFDQNPLTARVAVNRVWARLFGLGLVLTEEDFGSTGTRPSHPDLLDWLAVSYENDWGWSQKRLLRELVLSDAYRRSSAVRPELRQRDPMNRLLASGPRHRLPAETIRDSVLHAVGLLDETLGGRPVHPPLPPGAWQPFSPDPWETPKKGEPNRHRRGLYAYVKRTIPFPMFASFDAPSREFCASRRVRSNTPLQSLMTLNDETWVEAGDALASRMAAVEGTREEQIAWGFAAILSREPSETELQRLVELAKRFGDGGLRRVATVLLNLDEGFVK